MLIHCFQNIISINQEAKGLGHCMKLNSQNCSQILFLISMLKSLSTAISCESQDIEKTKIFWLGGDFCVHMEDAFNGDMHVDDTYIFKSIYVKKNFGLS